MDNSQLGDFKLYPNIKQGAARIGYVEDLQNIVRQKTGCGFDPVGDFNLYQRDIQVYPIKVDLEQCVDEFEQTVFAELLRSGNRKSDIQGTQIMNILTQSVQMGMQRDLNAIMWFGNKATGTDRLRVADGLLSVHIPALVTANLCPYKNAGSGAALTAGDARVLLTDVYDNSSNALKGLPASDKKYYVSGSVYDQLIADLENIDVAGGFTQNIENGRTVLRFRGIDVVVQREWDTLSAANSHYVVLTTPQNIVIGTDLFSDLSSYETWHDRKDEKVYLKARGVFGVNYAHPALFSVAY